MAIIKPKRSETASSVPTTSDIVAGEMAINIIDKKIYVRDSSNNIVEVANYTSGSTYTDAQADSDLNTSTATNNQILSWNGFDYDWIDTPDNKKIFTAAASFTAGDLVFLRTDGQIGNVNSDPFIGIAAENISSGSSGLVDVAGAINTNQTGLTIGSLYYRDTNNLLTTNSSAAEGLVGRALSSTELQIFETDHEYYSTSEINEQSYSLLLAIR